MNEAWYIEANEVYDDNKDNWRGVFIPFPEGELLEHCAAQLYKAFGATSYLVGSALYTKRYRDVDVRMIMSDDRYEVLFGTASTNPLWSIMCVSITAWMRQQTNLPIDFQIQRQSKANRIYHGPRSALGIVQNMRLEDDQLPAFMQKAIKR